MRKGKLALSQPVDILTKEPFFIFHTVPFTLFHFLTLNSGERLEDFQGHIVKEQTKTVH